MQKPIIIACGSERVKQLDQSCLLQQNEDLTKKLSELEVENKQTEAQLSAATGGRPKTARPVTRLAMAGKQGKAGKGVSLNLVQFFLQFVLCPST